VKRIVIDIQTIRFQIIINDPSVDLDGYTQRVNQFLDRVARRHEPTFEGSLLSTVEEDSQPVYLKYTLQSGFGATEQTFLWNTARPWEPIVRVVD
jgi:hypothetical protein